VPFKHLIQFVIPDYFGNPATLNYFGTWNYGEMIGYVGVVGVLFALLALKQRFADKKFFCFAILISLVFATDNPISHLPYLWKIPVLSLLQPTRLMAVIGFCLACFGAYGLDAFIQKKISKKHILLVSGLFVVVFILSLIRANSITLRNAAFPLLIFVLANGIILFRKQTALILVLLSLVDLMRFGWKFTPFTPPSYFFPAASILTEIQKDQLTYPTRTLVINPQVMPANTFSWYGIETVGGYNPFYSERYARFVQAMESDAVADALPAFQRIIEPTNTRSPLFKYFNVRYVVDIKDGKTALTELPSVMPRWYLADTMVVKPTGQEVLQAMLTDTVASRSAYVETTVGATCSATDTVSLVQYSANTQSLTTTVLRSGFLVNLTPWDSGWHAYINGKETPILRTNYLFMGISIPAGTHSVEYKYD